MPDKHKVSRTIRGPNQSDRCSDDPVTITSLFHKSQTFSFIGQWLWAQLVEWLLPTPTSVVRNQSLADFYKEHLFTVNCIEKTKIKKRPGMVHLKKTSSLIW